MTDIPRVLIVGAGELGTSLGKLLAQKQAHVYFFDTNPSRVLGEKSLKESLTSAAYVLLCVPSTAMRQAVTAASPFLEPHAVLISFAKGMEAASGKTMSELLSELLPPGLSLIHI